MTNYRFAFYVSEKQRTRTWGALLRDGARVHGDTVDILYQKDYHNFGGVRTDYDGAANLGMARACKRIMEGYLRAGKHFLFFDKGYMDRHNYWRVSIDAWQPLAYFQRFKRPEDRLSKTRQVILPRRTEREDDCIILAGACQNYHNFFDLGDVTEWCEALAQEMKEHSSLPVIYRPNPSWAMKHKDEYRPLEGFETSEPTTPFSVELKRCRLLVTHGSSAAVAALAAGIPIAVTGGGIARSMGDYNVNHLDDPWWPKERPRYQFFCDLAYCQWTIEEYRNGAAWEEIRLSLAALEGKAADTDLIKQYRLMHDSPKYFRGLSCIRYVEQIAGLIRGTKSETLLDFGSGKGEQYGRDEYKLHEVWGVQATCYDPGIVDWDPLLPVEAITDLPSNRVWDGVICCDVMEHIPEEEVPVVLHRILSCADKFVFFSISTTPANKVLPDGRNCHLTIRPREWWGEQIARASVGFPRMEIEAVVTGAPDAAES